MNMDEENFLKDVPIKSVEKVALSIERCKGEYAFLVGAGMSKAAGINTAGELIDQWKDEEYNRCDPDLDKNEWIEKTEGKMGDDQNGYGFWFEQRYTTREERRRFIKDLVAEADPTFEHIVLSSLMTNGYVPITLTPNFDDLIYDAFYLYHEERPLLVDHNALAPQFKILYGDPMIVKLHGDYLYYNLKNTNSETNELEENIGDVLKKTMSEYGLIVLGYSGRDESIMQVLNSNQLDIPDQGLYWCTVDKDNISSKVRDLLKKDNTFLVEIESSIDFFYELYENLEDLNVPTPVDIRENADKRANQLEEGIINVGGFDVRGLAREYTRRDKNDDAIDLLTQAIENGENDPEIFSMRANLYDETGDHEQAIIDLSSSIEIVEERVNEAESDDERETLETALVGYYNKRGIQHTRSHDYDEAIKDFECTLETSGHSGYPLNIGEALMLAGNIEDGIQVVDEVLQGTDDATQKASCIILVIIGNILIGEDYSEEKERLEQLSEEGFMAGWNFKEIESFLVEKEVDSQMKEEIRDMIEFYEELASQHSIPPVLEEVEGVRSD